jgi:hypothetical protein
LTTRDEQWVVQFAGGRLEQGGMVWRWETVGVYRVVEGKIAECWLLPFDQYRFDEIWSVQDDEDRPSASQ